MKRAHSAAFVVRLRAARELVVPAGVVVCHPGQGIIVSVAMYLDECLRWRSLSEGSAYDEALIIRDWVTFLDGRGFGLHQASDFEFISWIEISRSRAKCSKQRIARRASVVWKFYRFAKGLPGADPGFRKFFEQISHTTTSPIGDSVSSQRYSANAPATRPHPRVPTDDQVEKVLKCLAQHPVDFISERNWLIGRCMSEVGLRAMGVQALSVSSIKQCLRIEGIIGEADDFDGGARIRETRVLIRTRLISLAEQRRSELQLSVTEKGGRVRNVALPISLAQSLIEHVWGRRSRLIDARIAGEIIPDGVFLSYTTAKPIATGSIKDIVAELGFGLAGILGAGHSLRAYYLTCRAISLINEAKELFGNRYDPQMIMHQLAELAGHSHWHTLKFYLDQARIRQVLLSKFSDELT